MKFQPDLYGQETGKKCRLMYMYACIKKGPRG